MKTSVIKYRVADFLRRNPPFSEIDNLDLLDLAASGRVVFHESDEFIFHKDDTRAPFIWVIQQGRVQLLEGDEGDEQLKDILGEGDLLGLGRFLGHTTYRYSARTGSDVILYSIAAPAFELLAKRNAAVSRFLSAHFSMSERYAENAAALTVDEIGRRKAATAGSWLDVAGPDEIELREHLVTIDPDASIAEAAQTLKDANASWVAAVSDGVARGLIGADLLRESIIEGIDPRTARAASIMETQFLTAALHQSVGDYFLTMMRGRSTVLAVTEDGTREGKLRGVLDASYLSLFCGWNPALILREMVTRTTLTDCSRLLSQATSLVNQGLVDTSDIDKAFSMSSEFLDALIEQLIRKATSELLIEGLRPPEIAHSWLVFGRTARRENFPFTRPDLGVAFAESSRFTSRAATAYFTSVIARVARICASIGLSRSGDELRPGIINCRSLPEWRQFFTDLATDPIGEGIYGKREILDFRPLFGDLEIAASFQELVTTAVSASDAFVPVLANDTMSNLPPLTFFEGLVIELDGAQRDTLDLEETLVVPIVDAARVCAFASRNLGETNTLRRLAEAVKSLPRGTSILLEAAEASRMAMAQIARLSSDARELTTVVQPSTLSKFDQRRLKTAFGSVQNLLKLASTMFDQGNHHEFNERSPAD